MKLLSKRIIASAIITGLCIPVTSYATNGYFLIGYGSKSRSMGGVGVAKGQDGFAAAFNPATMSDVAEKLNDDNNLRFDIGADIFKPNAAVYRDQSSLLGPVVDTEVDSPSTAFSKNGFYLLPNLGWVAKINDQLSWGFSMIGNGAAAVYDQTVPEGETSYFFNFNGNSVNELETRLLNLQLLPSIAYKIDNHQSIGATLVISYGLFKATGLETFDVLGFGAESGNLSSMGTDTSWGGGIRLGWKGKFLNEKLHVGANYSSRTYMQEFDDYKNLFAEQGDFDIPSNYAIGLSYTASPDINVYFDYQRINFSEVASVGNKGPKIIGDFFPCGSIDCGALGKDEGLGFGWTDQDIIKIGIEYQYNNKLILRAGYNHGDATIPEDQVLFSMLAPATVEDHITLGATYQYSKNIEISASYVHAFENTINGPSPGEFQPPGADLANPVDNVSLAMEQNSVGVTLGMKF